jgi:AraC-like DNA-binding protein
MNNVPRNYSYRWGFSSPSRFAERYRIAFGCCPSETLRR